MRFQRPSFVSIHCLVSVLSAANLMMGSVAHAQGDCGQWQPGPLVSSSPNGTNGIVRALVNWDPDSAGPLPDHLVIGGAFTLVEGVVANGIAVRSPTTGQWQSLSNGVSGQVRALAVFNGELIAAGNFATASGNFVNNIARWDGSAWQAMGSGIELPVAGDSGVFALAVHNGQLYVGGLFIAAGGLPIYGIARWTGSAWASVGNGLGAPSEWVSTLTVHVGELVMGGNFTSVSGVAANNIARSNGFFWQPLGSGTNSTVGTSCSLNGELYAGGTFNLAGGVNVTYSAKWNGTSWAALPQLLFPVTLLAVHNGQVWMATSTGQLAQLYFYTGTQWSNVTSFAPVVYAITTHGSDLVVGGNFSSAGNTTANFIARRIGTLWYAFGGLSASSVRALHLFGSRLLVGGAFRQATSAGSPIDGVLAWDGSAVHSVNLMGYAEVLDLISYDAGDGSGNHVLLAGRAGAPYVMRATADPASDPSGWTWTSANGIGVQALNGEVYTVERYNGQTYIGGEFVEGHPTTVGRNGIARMSGASAWAAVGGGLDGPVYALKAFGGQLYAGGAFTSADSGSVFAVRLVAWNGTAWSAVDNTAFNGARVNALEVYDGRLIIGGEFPGPAGSPNIAAFNGSAVGSIGPFGNGGANGPVHMLKAIGTRLYVGGAFSMIDGVPADRMAYWDGSTWHEVSGGANGIVYAIEQFNDQFHVGGMFTGVGEPPTSVPYWTYEQACELCPGDITPDGAVNVDDLLAIINAWGACANPNDCPADIAPPGGNDIVDVDDLLAVINGWGPCP